MSERFYIHCADDNNKQLFDTESDFNIHIEEVGSDEELIQLCDLLNEQDRKIKRWKTLYEIKDKEVTARVKRLNEICNQYKHTITFDKDIDPNDAVNILCDRILQTEVEM